MEVSAKERRYVEPRRLKRVSYARLVRKGGRESGLSHSAEAGFALRSTLPNASGPCWGAVVGYRLDLESVTLGSRFAFCTSSFENRTLSARTNEYAVAFSAERAWDFANFSLSLGGGGGAVLTTQSFDTLGRAPSRHSTSPLLFAVLGLSYDVSNRIYTSVDARAEAQLVRLQKQGGGDSNLVLPLAVRGNLLMGARF